jgi:protein-S-isoprenylcysteine O-methyltransferase Ste14
MNADVPGRHFVFPQHGGGAIFRTPGLEGSSMSMTFTAVAAAVVVAGLWKYRRDYRKYRRTTWLGVFAIFAVFSIPNLVVGLYVPWIGFPATGLQMIGFVLILAGILICFFPIIRFGSVKKVVGMLPGGLDVSGLYGYSRNPQYVGYGLFLLGWSLFGSSPRTFAGVALYWIVVHLTILIEEEHLAGIYGDAYQEYKRKTPRYLVF